MKKKKKLELDYHRLKIMVKRSIEQEIRNNNFGARSGNFEKNAVVKNQGTQQRVQRILGDCWQWETNGQFVKGDNCSFRHDMNKRGKSSPSNPSPNSFMRQSERKPSRTRSPRGKRPSGRMSRWLCEDYLRKICNNSFCEQWQGGVAMKNPTSGNPDCSCRSVHREGQETSGRGGRENPQGCRGVATGRGGEGCKHPSNCGGRGTMERLRAQPVAPPTVVRGQDMEAEVTRLRAQVVQLAGSGTECSRETQSRGQQWRRHIMPNHVPGELSVWVDRHADLLVAMNGGNRSRVQELSTIISAGLDRLTELTGGMES